VHIYGHTFFCDDYRLESDGKFTVVGILPAGGLIVNGLFPANIPKFVMWINYFEAFDAPNEDLELSVSAPGEPEPIARWTAPLRSLRVGQTIPQEFLEDPVSMQRVFQFPLVFAPLVLRAKGWIRIRGTVGPHQVKLGALFIDQKVPEPSASG